MGEIGRECEVYILGAGEGGGSGLERGEEKWGGSNVRVMLILVLYRPAGG